MENTHTPASNSLYHSCFNVFHSDLCKVIFRCKLNLQSVDYWWAWASFQVYWEFGFTFLRIIYHTLCPVVSKFLSYNLSELEYSITDKVLTLLQFEDKNSILEVIKPKDRTWALEDLINFSTKILCNYLPTFRLLLVQNNKCYSSGLF